MSPLIHPIFLHVPKCLIPVQSPIRDELNQENLFTTNDFNSKGARNHIPYMIVLESLKFLIHHFAPTVMSNSLWKAFKNRNRQQSSVKRSMVITIPIRKTWHPGRSSRTRLRGHWRTDQIYLGWHANLKRSCRNSFGWRVSLEKGQSWSTSSINNSRFEPVRKRWHIIKTR
jgi:hypothetical protein